MNFNQISDITSGQVLQLADNEDIKELITDTRKISIRLGALFFAIAGKNHDGHQYIHDAYEKGIRMFVVEKSIKLPDDASVILVSNAIIAMQKLVAVHRKSFKYPVIGITGSNGKTIVKEWLAQMLDYKYSVVKSPKSYNSQLGVSLSVWQMTNQHNVAIFEAGISEIGEMARLEPIIKPSLGIFTNIGEAHNAGFESQIQKTKEKSKLFKNCTKIIYCKSHELVHETLVNSFDSDVIYHWHILETKGQKISIKVRDDIFTLNVKFKDSASIENCLHCAATLHVLGFGTDIIQQRLDTLSTVKMRLEMKQAINRSYVIDDTYNNDLYGLEVAISVLASNQQKPKKTLILSDLYQTGLDKSALYKRVSELVKNNKIQRFVGIGTNISEEKGLFQMESYFFDTTEAFLKSDFRISDEIVLVKGSRNFAFEKIVDQLEYKAHGTVLEVNLENVVHNLNFYRSKLKSETKIMVMVKAFAYGGGNFEIANLLQFHKVDYLGVAYTDEAVELRKNGVHIPIMIMNPSPDSFRLLREYNLEPEIFSLDQLVDFIYYFEGEENIPAIHIKLETGMNRLGFRESEIPLLIDFLKKEKQLKVKSIFSHLAGSDDPRHKEFTNQQSSKFEAMSKQLLEVLWYTPMLHLVNTGGISQYPNLQYDMVRLGIGLYGFDPTQNETKEVLAIGTLKTQVSQVKHIKAGESIGYSRVGFAKKDMTIAVVPIGYADGYLRAFSNGVGKMSIQGELVETVGNICMDMTMLDITGLTVKSGEEVIVFGENPTISDLARWIGTIPYEILTNVSQRVKRAYISG